MTNRILYVDDDRNMLKAFERLMRRQPFACITFASAQKALEQLPHIQPVVVISDQKMPEMMGTDFLEQVKSILPDTIRMIVTGYPDLQVALSAINQGNVFRFLEKPWDEETLIRCILDAVSYREKLRRMDHAPVGANGDDIRKERMQGVMELAGAVSHAFCQPIQVMQGYADIMQMSIRKEHAHHPYLSNLQKQITRMKDLITQVQSIKRYRTCEHAGRLRMIDLEKASSEE